MLDAPAAAFEVKDPSPGADDYARYARLGEVAALERCLHACADRAYTQARRHLGNDADADDAVQEAFLQLARSASRFDGSVPFAAWLGRLVQIACLRQQRSDQRRRRREELAMAVPRPDHEADTVSEAVRALVERLPQADRAVIDLHYYAGLSQADVAIALGTNENAIAQRLSRARGRLRKLMGSSASVASIALVLAAQPTYAASPQVLSGITTLSTMLAAGSALPATTISLSLSQKGLLVMSSHPLITAACLGLAILACTVPTLVWSADADSPPPLPAPAVAGAQAWQGKARELLPFIDPSAPVQMAVDWEFLRVQGALVKPTSLLADPRAQAAVDHIREQSRLWSISGSGMPDLMELFASASGGVLSFGTHPAAQVCLVAELGTRHATAAQQFWSVEEDRRKQQWTLDATLRRTISTRTFPVYRPVQSGPFSGFEMQPGVTMMQADGRWAIAALPALKAGFTRRPGPLPATAPLWFRWSAADLIATLARLDSDRSDPLGMATWLGPDWREAKPTLTLEGARHNDQWRSTATLTGLALPLRPLAAQFTGCVPQDALATLALGLDVERCAELLAAALDEQTRDRLMKMLNRSGVEPSQVGGWLSGDVVVVVQQQEPIPACTVVLGLRPDAVRSLRAVLEQVLPQAGLNPSTLPNTVAGWSGATPMGMIQVAQCEDRLVLSSGDVAPFLNPASATVSDLLTVDIDVPTVARTYLPVLIALLPDKPVYLDYDNEFNYFISHLTISADLRRKSMQMPKNPQPRVDLDALGKDDLRQSIARAAWKNLVGSDLPIHPRLAIYYSATKVPPVYPEPRVVIRTALGWRLMTFSMNMDVLQASEDFTEMTALKSRLAGFVLAAGTEPENLIPIALPEQVTFDRRWLPPLAAMIDHMPRYRLGLQATKDGYRVVEDGLPLAGGMAIMATTIYQGESRLVQRLHEDAVLRRDHAGLMVTHQTAITALRRAAEKLHQLSPTDKPIMAPSEMLALAGIPLADLASLNGGIAPSPEHVDALGFWRASGWPHDHCIWSIPLAGGLFVQMAWWNYQGVDVVGASRVTQRAMTEAEKKDLIQSWRDFHGGDRLGDPEPAAPPEVAPSDF